MAFFFAGLILVSCSDRVENYRITIDELDKFSPAVVIMNPTVKNIKTFRYLTEKGIFPIEGDYSVIGVYHKNSVNDYQSSHDFLVQNGLDRFRLLEFDDSLSPVTIYGKNSCSPTFSQLFEKACGIIFFGGPDIPPACYGEETHLTTQIEDPYRHYLELSFLFHLIGGYQDTAFIPLLSKRPDFPVLGICLGMQSMNVAAGGSLYQDIPMQIYGLQTVEQVLNSDRQLQHRNYHNNFGVDNELIWGSFHSIRYDEASIFHSLTDGTQQPFYVWSSHHQCVKALGKGYQPIAWSVDGKIIEAIVHTQFSNVLGVQFHPEPRAIFDTEIKLKQLPIETNPLSYPELYPTEKGVTFHRRFWAEMGKRFSGSK